MSNREAGARSRGAGVTESSSSVAPPPSTFPPGLNPENYPVETVSHLLKQAAYFPIFSVHNPAVQNVVTPSPSNPRSLIAMKVFEELHRFVVDVGQPTLEKGLRAANLVAEPVASVRIDWRPIPEDFMAAPGKLPPPTELDPTQSQRFAMYDGQFQFKDRQNSGFHGFGAGRTFPVMVDGQPQLRIGAVVDILEGFGQLKGFGGNVVINGFIRPPEFLALNMIARIIDPKGSLKADSAVTTPRPIPPPDPTATFLVFLGEADPDNPITLNVAPGGRVLGATVHELLRIVHISFDVGTSKGLRSKTSEGAIVGSLTFTLKFDSRDPRVPTPFQTTDSLFTFFDRERRSIGTLSANVVEGRGFLTELEGAPPPVLRMGGFGPFLGGSGQFSGASGMLSLNGIICIPVRTPSILYVLRVSDPDGKFRGALHDAWS